MLASPASGAVYPDGRVHGNAGAPPAVSICRRCGVVAPAHRTSCAVCKGALAETRVAMAPASPETFWVAVRCTFTCNSCKFPAPLDGLEVDGAVECAHCGLRQRFEVGSWAEAISFAHAVGDLAGPLPEGRFPHPTLWIGSENPYAGIGETETFRQRESGVLSLEAAPGHPVCRACRVPFEVSVTGPGVVSAHCPHCGDRAGFTVSEDARGFDPDLLAVVADEHRTDRPRARSTQTEAGVVALSCPGCGAPLPLGHGERAQTCAFCKVVCFVPTRSLLRARNEVPMADVWWLLFKGPSAERRALEAPTDDTRSAAKAAALSLVNPGAARTDPIGEAPGVYEAPEVPGIYWPQVGLTAVLGSAAVILGVVLYELFGP